MKFVFNAHRTLFFNIPTDAIFKIALSRDCCSSSLGYRIILYYSGRYVTSNVIGVPPVNSTDPLNRICAVFNHSYMKNITIINTIYYVRDRMFFK